jgi:hypothetical protein
VLLLLLALFQDDLQAALDEAVQAGRPRVVLAAGVHRLPPRQGRWCLSLRDAQDLEIDARGAELLITDPAKGGLEFSRCRNIRLRGLTLCHELPPFTQGRVEAVADEEKSVDVRIDVGYPGIEGRAAGYVFDPSTRRIKAGSIDLGPERVERLEDGMYRLRYAQKSGVVVGDLMAFRGHGVTDIYLGACSGMTIEDVTILSGGGFCVHEDGGGGGNRYRYSVTYGPKPPGATAAPLLACNADAFHSSGVRKGPTLEGCLFEGMGDDGVPIHGSYALIVESRSRSLIATEGVLREGDPLRLFNPDGGFAGEAKVTSIRQVKDFAVAARSRFHGFADLTRSRFVEVVTEPAMAAGFDWQASNPAALGSGFVIRNNVIRNHRARGILIKADDGIIEGNTIEGSTIAGIVLAPELWWREACYSRNVVIRNNTISRCGTASMGPWTAQAGALSVTAESKPGAEPGHRQIVIEDNRFLENDGVNLLLQAVDGALVKGNRFERPDQAATRRGSGRQLDPGALIWVSDCRNIRLEGNKVANPGAAMSTLIGVGPRTTALVGRETGIER